jgi:DNA repair protein RadC
MHEPQSNNLTIKSWAEEDRPREKLLLKGKASLSDAELIAIIIGSGSGSMSAVDLSKLILNKAGNDLNELARLSIKDLMKFKGIGEAKAISIAAAIELGRRRKDTAPEKRETIVTPSQIYELMKPHMLDLPHEEMWIVLLNRANQVIKIQKVGAGGVAGVYADTKIVLKYALENLASSVILVHNHPSGQLKPSQEDISFTNKVKDGGSVMDIYLADHLIFTDNAYYSFKEKGNL